MSKKKCTLKSKRGNGAHPNFEWMVYEESEEYKNGEARNKFISNNIEYACYHIDSACVGMSQGGYDGENFMNLNALLDCLERYRMLFGGKFKKGQIVDKIKVREAMEDSMEKLWDSPDK